MIRIYRHYISSAYLWLLLVEGGLFFMAMYGGRLLLASGSAMADVEVASLVYALVLTLCCAGMGLYRRSLSTDDYQLLPRATLGFVVATLVLVAIYYFFPAFFIAPKVLVVALVLGFAALSLTRYAFYHLSTAKALGRRVLVIGAGRKASHLSQVNNSFIHRAFSIEGFVPLAGDIVQVAERQLVRLDGITLAAVAGQLNIDEIVIAPDDSSRPLPLDALLDCKMSGFTILDLVSFHEREQCLLSLEDLDPTWLIFSDGFAQGGLRELGKRGFDIAASLLLLMVAWPFMAIAALAIGVESRFKGPVFYRQLRVGENNALFKVIKFRSMRTDAEKHGAQWAKANDDRITRVGAVIRKFRIDELPQIFNVLRGEMSFVGPRPERPEFVVGFEQRIPYYRERHRVKPGITGWAQLCYPYGADEQDAIQKLQYDLYYVKNYSLFLDISIMFNTIEVVLWGRGAR